MKGFVKIAIAMLVVGGIAAGVALAVMQGTPVETAVTERGTIRAYVEERGKTRLPEVYRLTMPLDGRIQRITLDAGAPVEEGEIVAQMETDDLETDLMEARARVAQFEHLLKSIDATINSAEAQLQARQEQFQFLNEEYERIRGLIEKMAVTPSELREAETRMRESRFNVAEEEFTIQSIASIRAAAEIGKEVFDEQRQQQQRDRNRASLYSPVDGVVLERHVSNERVLPAGEPLLEIGQLDELEVGVEVLTQDAVSIVEGDAVDIEGPAVGNQAVRGIVTRINPRGFTKVSSLGVEQQRVLVVVQFLPDELDKLRDRGVTLKVDYRVRVRIYTNERSDTLKIPRFALFRGQNGNWQTFAVRDGRAERVDLEVGLMNNFEVEILSGLAEDDRVIIAPESSLSDGARVEIRSAE